ncbi:MAG: hypothetical protein R2911_32905 [Caldilineaceae bacterium]
MSAFHYLQAPFSIRCPDWLFTAAGTPAPIADDVSAILINANLAGHDSHGVLRIRSICSKSPTAK